MFGYWLIVLSSVIQILRIFDKKDISKEPEAEDPVVRDIMVEKLDGTIDCINIVFNSVALGKPDRLFWTQEKYHDKVRKEKAYEYGH